ncbi:MAG: hypothetical protein HPY80_03330 [Bacteroidales bacterium]|mgnify:CR=1 FL=1|jgi:hypothetical protein|nr:hypothetical protein [Bacteroidales bacterium]NPV35688.1 hypothetical protein [Bacteroidales bacterium]
MSNVRPGVEVNNEQCKALGRKLAHYHFRDEFYMRPFLTVDLLPEEKARMYFFSVGICHQTWNLANRPANFFGWDYLEDGFIRIFKSDSWLADPLGIVNSSDEAIAEGLASFFIPPESRISTLDRLEERATLYKDMAVKLLENYQGSVLNLLQTTEGRAGGENGIYKCLAIFEAYSDPLFKKASFLIKLLSDAGLFSIKDPENLVPVMDYHMQRVLLRTGAVEIHDLELHEALAMRKELPDDGLIREACIQASVAIAASAGRGVLQMNDVLYMMGRSCCFEEPLCISGRCAKRPCSLTRTLHIKQHQNCIFNSICKGERFSSYRELWNPVVKTHYY